MTILIAVDALICERSVTKAAKRVRVGQPSMGHLLATLSVLPRDELVVLVGHSVSPHNISFCFTNGSPKLRKSSKVQCGCRQLSNVRSRNACSSSALRVTRSWR